MSSYSYPNGELLTSTQSDNKKWIVTVIALIGIVLLGWTVYWYLAVYGKMVVNIVVAPSTATVSINGKKSRSGEHLLSPGEYEVEATKDGYGSFSQLVVVGDKEVVIPIALVPQTDEAKQEAIKLSAEYSKIEALSGLQAQAEGEVFRQEYPIVKHLPYKSLLFNIDYRLTTESDGGVILQISADSDLDREFALSQIRNWGYNPEDFIIEYLE